MDALRRSIAAEKQSTAPSKKGRKRIAGQTEMLLPIPGKKGKEAAASEPVARAGTRQKKIS
jgi:DNA end-binding protein Ku